MVSKINLPVVNGIIHIICNLVLKFNGTGLVADRDGEENHQMILIAFNVLFVQEDVMVVKKCILLYVMNMFTFC